MTNEPRVWVSVFGPLECRIGGRPVTVRSRKQRGILAVLALSAPETVSRNRLIEALWGDAIPPSARNTLEAHVSRLRRVFAENGLGEQVVRTRDPGYVLDSETDVRRFEAGRASAAAKAARGETQAAADDLTAALTLWRGNALADLVDEPFAALEAARLEGLWLAAREELVRLRLDLGDHRWAIPELESLMAVQPLPEGPRRLLMLALYRAGRQADALALYRETRALLRRELGLEPSPELRELEQAILRHDASLRLPADGDRPSTAPPVRRIAPSRRRLVVAGATALAAVAAAAAVLGLLLTRSSGPIAPTHPRAFGARLLARIPSPLPSCCGFGFGGVWIVGHHDGTLKEIDPATNRIVARYPIAGFQALEPLAAVGSIWVPSAGGDFVRFDPVKKRVVARFAINAAHVAWAYGSIWATTRDHHLVRIDYGRNRIVKRLRLIPGYNDFDDGLAVGYGSVWITVADTATVLRIDPETMTVIGRISGFGDTYSWMPVTVGDGSVWVYRITGSRSILYRINPYTNQIVKRIVFGRPNVAWPNGYILDADGYVWACDAGNTMSQIDPRSNRVVDWFTLPETCQEVAFGDGSIWTALYNNSQVLRIRPAA